ncbi:unnamed protein product, partial [Closterium sp. NIES-53]
MPDLVPRPAPGPVPRPRPARSLAPHGPVPSPAPSPVPSPTPGPVPSNARPGTSYCSSYCHRLVLPLLLLLMLQLPLLLLLLLQLLLLLLRTTQLWLRFRVLAFDHEGRPVQFDTWLDDLKLYLQSDSKDSVSLFDLASGAATAPPATADSLTRDAAARLAIRNHLPLAECAHFGQHRTAQALYDTVVARYSSPATSALGRLLLPYLFPEFSAFAIVEDLVSHLRASDARYRAAVLAEFLDRNPPP